MKHRLLLLLLFVLAGCGKVNSPRHVDRIVNPTLTDLPSATVRSVTLPTAEATAADSLTAAEAEIGFPGSADWPNGKQAEASGQVLLPVSVGQVTLGPPIFACAGDGVFVVEDGTVFTLGRRAGYPCASVVDLATGSVSASDPPAPSLSRGEGLEVSDPRRARVYVAENGKVIAYDCCGFEKGAVMVLPGERRDGILETGLRLSDETDRLYLSYQTKDGQDWIAAVDLNSGETIVDVPIPPGHWGLITQQDGMGVIGRRDLLVFSDSNTLVVLDGERLHPVDRFSLSRRPASAVVEPSGSRLFVTDAGGDLHVLDSTTLTEIDRLPGAGALVDLDLRSGRVYVGDRYTGGMHEVDLATTEPIRRIPRAGRPIADPLDGQVYTFTHDIFSGEPIPSVRTSVDPATSRAFVARATDSQQPVYSLALYSDFSLPGLSLPDLPIREPTVWVDGLYGDILYNPVVDQLYLAQGGRLLVLDGQTLELLGGINVGTDLGLLAVDRLNGALIAAQGEQLVRFELRETSANAPQPEQVEILPGPVYGIVVSPQFERDATLFACATDWETGLADLYRSTNGAKTWTRLKGGLPDAPGDLVYGPYGRLYAAMADIGWQAAPEAAVRGEGVYVSEDGGDTWRPDNTGLTHMRVGRLHVGDDGVLYAQAASSVEPGHAASVPTIWARVPDQVWVSVPMPDAGPLRLQDLSVPVTYTQAVRVYWHELTDVGPLYQSWGQDLRRSDDGGQTWVRVGHGPTEYADEVFVGTEAIFWMGPKALWRSTDEGETWAALHHPELSDAAPFSMAVVDVDGAETLFLGTETGKVLIVPAGKAAWVPLVR